MDNVRDLTDHDDFDHYARECGWVYDNGWSYQAEHWDSYGGPAKFKNHQMLRLPPGRIILIKTDRPNPVQVWSGNVLTSRDFDAMIVELKILIE